MGGSAFASDEDPLNTPPMPPIVYQSVRNRCHKLLLQWFDLVATPIEGPAKKFHGDVDIFLAFKSSPNAATLSSPQTTIDDRLDMAASLLNPERQKQQGNTLTIAIPWPEELCGEEGSNDKESSKPRFIQVDIHYCQNLDKYHWMLFKHAHGDLWNILGSIIRPFGLTADEEALHLRIPEVEKENRKASKVPLTPKPADVLDFLGLASGTQWEKPFSTVEDLFEYAATCRFFWIRGKKSPSDDELDYSQQSGDEFGKYKPTLKSKDRHKTKYRPLFREWIDVFLPKCREQGRFGKPQFTRAEVRDQAFARFGVQKEYEKRLEDWRRERQEQTLFKNVIKASLPENDNKYCRGLTASALKKIILKGDKSFGISPPKDVKDPNGFYNEARVVKFVKENWEKVGDVAWKQSHDKWRESLKKKGKEYIPKKDRVAKKAAAAQEDAAGKDGAAAKEEKCNGKA